MPGILFLCVHNAGRSQMAAAFARELGGDRAEIFSGGSEPADRLNPMAVAAMAELGIDISACIPQKFTIELLDRVDVVITMGCGDTCPYIPGKRYIDWPLDDPRGQTIEVVRGIRDRIHGHVVDLLKELEG